MSEVKLNITLEQLEHLLNMQKLACANKLTGNLSNIYGLDSSKLDLDVVKHSMRARCKAADYPEDFKVLEKYLSDA